MRVIARRTLIEYAESCRGHRDYPALKAALETWFADESRARWQTSADVKQRYATASIVSAERIVFNIKGNDYRLVVAVSYAKRTVWIKWIGTHAEYDRINVLEVDHGR